MKNIIVLNGIHGSGKTTLAEAFAAANEGYKFFPEIGGQLRQKVAYNVLERRDDFDLAVMEREIARDQELLRCAETPVVETWHVGNLAYVLARSPRLFDRYKAAFELQRDLFNPLVFLITIDWPTFRRRATEKIRPQQMVELQGFYQHIIDNTRLLYESLGIPFLEVSNNNGVGDALATIRRNVFSQVARAG